MPISPSHRVCPACTTPVDVDQRYCIACGERQVELPARVRELLALDAPVVPPFSAPQMAVAAAPAAGGFRLPKPRDMAIAVLAVLGFGVVVGAAVTPAQSAAPAYIVAVNSPPPPAPAPTPAPPADTGADVAAAPPVQVVTVAAPAPAAVAPAPAKKKPAADNTPAPPATPTLPPIRHVFLIVLSDQGFNQSFGADSQAPYLSKTLTGQGELLTNYYAVAPGNLANGAALISGQGPTVSTTQNCPAYTDITPGTIDKDGQVIGDGCVYPKAAQTVGDELTAAGHSWKAYVQGMGTAPDGKPATCRTPAAPTTPAAAVDPAAATTTPATPDPYAPWRNPWVYFHSVTDTPLCAQNDVGLEQLATDLKSETTAPSLAYIVPDLCHDGSDTPCAPGQPAGMAQADAFLQEVVPQIMDSDAYKNGGMIAITFDQAPQTGDNADSSGLTDDPVYPNLPTTPAATPTPTTPTTPADPTAAPPADPAAPPAATPQRHRPRPKRRPPTVPRRWRRSSARPRRRPPRAPRRRPPRRRPRRPRRPRRSTRAFRPRRRAAAATSGCCCCRPTSPRAPPVPSATTTTSRC